MANYNPWLGAAALQSVGEEHRGDGSKSSQGANAVISRSRAPTGVEEINSGLKILLPVDFRDTAWRCQMDPCSPARGSPEKWVRHLQPPTLVVAEQSEGQALEEWAEVMWSPGKYVRGYGAGELSIHGITINAPHTSGEE